MIDKIDIALALRAAGIETGDTVFLNCSLWKFGAVFAKSSDDMQRLYYDTIRDVLGSSGTIVVNSQTTHLTRSGEPFVVEETSTEGGGFSEFIRTKPGAVRSCHPVVSMTALGPKAEDICGRKHASGYGYFSPCAVLLELNAKIVSLGTGYGHHSTSFQHFLEQMYGVPYQYTKIFDIAVYMNNKRVEGPFTLNVRYPNFGISYDAIPFRRSLVDRDLANLVSLGRGEIFSIPASVFFREGMNALSKNRYAFCSEVPKFEYGKIPFDGPVESSRTGVKSLAKE